MDRRPAGARTSNSPFAPSPRELTAASANARLPSCATRNHGRRSRRSSIRGPARGVDWRQDQLLVLFAGERPSGGTGSKSRRITMEGAEAIVHVTDIQPDASCSSTQALTYPFAVIAMPRSTRDPVARWTPRTGPSC